MEVNDVLLEILSEVKKLSSEQATTNAKLENCVKTTDRQEVDIKQLQNTGVEVQKHSTIIKGMLWVYGLVIAGVIGKYITTKI